MESHTHTRYSRGMAGVLRSGLLAAAVGACASFAGAAAAATPPPTPNFPANIDDFASYDSQSTCDPSEKAGVVEYKDLILGAYPSTGNYGIVRACNVGGTSEHKEGRAWDWKVNYYDTAQRDIAQTVIDWMLATDQHGNACAIARRFGVMYFIWNNEIWGSYRAPNSSCATGGWKAYTGSNPHTDHVHLSYSWSGANEQTTWFTSTPLPTNRAPEGYLDEASCSRVRGWAFDADAGSAPIDAHLYFGGPANDPNAVGVPVTAADSRNDLCGPLGSCDHGFEVASPLSLHDGQPHAVHAYAIDSAGGANTQLEQSPGSIQCDPVVPEGVRRHITSRDSFDSWGFSDFWDVMPVPDATLGGISEDVELGFAPELIQADDGSPEVWVVDSGLKRHVPSQAVLSTWGWSASDIQLRPPSEVAALPQGPDWRERPVLIKASGPAVYLMDWSLTDSSAPQGPGGTGGTGAGAGGMGGMGGGGWPDGETGGSNGVGTHSQVLGEDDEGCGCAVPGRSSRGPSGALLLLAGLALGSVRRRRRATRR